MWREGPISNKLGPQVGPNNVPQFGQCTMMYSVHYTVLASTRKYATAQSLDFSTRPQETSFSFWKSHNKYLNHDLGIYISRSSIIYGWSFCVLPMLGKQQACFGWKINKPHHANQIFWNIMFFLEALLPLFIT